MPSGRLHQDWTTLRLAGIALALSHLAGAAPSVAAGSPLARYEPGLMVLLVTLILVLGAGTLRLLVHVGIIRNLTWLAPILIALSGLGWAGMHVFGLAAELPRTAALLRFLLLVLIFVSSLYPLARLVLPEPAQRTRGGVPPLIRGVAVAILAFLGIFVLLTWSFPGLSLTPVFLTSGAVSIVLGLAVQDLLSNLLAGVVLSLERPFALGDWVRISDVEGEVVAIAWRATTVRTREHDCVIIPNNLTVREKVTNFDRPTPLHLLKLTVGVSYETPCGLAVAAFEEAAARVVGVLETPAPSVHFLDYLDSALLYELRVWVDNYESVPAVRSDLNRELWYACKRHGITIPFPQRDVHVRQVAETRPVWTARLVATRGPLRGALVDLTGPELVIGRSPDCGVCISDPRVSSRQARIESVADGHRLHDLGHRHGTLLNGAAVVTADLRQGDEIGIGPATLVYECHGRDRAARREVVWAAPRDGEPPPGSATAAGPGSRPDLPAPAAPHQPANPPSTGTSPSQTPDSRT